MRKILVIALYVVPVLILVLPKGITGGLITSDNWFLGSKLFLAIIAYAGIDLLVLFLRPTMKGWVILYDGNQCGNEDGIDIMTSYKEPELLIRPFRSLISFRRNVFFPYIGDLYPVKVIAPYGVKNEKGESYYRDHFVIYKNDAPYSLWDSTGKELKITIEKNLQKEQEIKKRINEE